MVFKHPAATLTMADGRDLAETGRHITHLGVGAHPDDLEFMALHGILDCYHNHDLGFGGVTCTNGGGSAHAGGLSEEALIARRHAEQEEAARIGRYRFMAQLGYSSTEAKNAADSRLTEDLVTLFQTCRPRIVYTHNPTDQHETHIAVMSRVVQALRKLSRDHRPEQLLGCEVWRGLDWLCDHDKIHLNVSANPELAERLAGVFTTQIAGGKRYDLAVRGRERANATFMASHRVDGPPAVWFAMDLTPLLVDEHMSIRQLVNGHLARFKNDVMSKLNAWEP